jgi:hypothetical protein
MIFTTFKIEPIVSVRFLLVDGLILFVNTIKTPEMTIHQVIVHELQKQGGKTGAKLRISNGVMDPTNSEVTLTRTLVPQIGRVI